MTAALPIIGRSTTIVINGIRDVPAKVDTGADASSVWASDIRLESDGLHFKLFGAHSKYFAGEEVVVPEGHFVQKRIVSSTGGREERYAVELPVVVEGQEATVVFSLSDRLTLAYPILLGCSFLAGRFLVDCAQQISTELHQHLIDEKMARRKIVGR